MNLKNQFINKDFYLTPYMIWDILRKQKKSLLKPPEIVKKMSEISAHKVASFPDSLYLLLSY